MSHPIHDHYFASSDGEIKNSSDRIIKFLPNLKSYNSSVAIWSNKQRYYLSASKFIFECFYGLVPKGLIVMHHDEWLPAPYINAPFNLFLGTQSLNMKDAYAKKRISPTKGEASGKTNLSQADVDQIRYLRSKNYSYKQIQKEFPIAKSTISYIVNKKTWK